MTDHTQIKQIEDAIRIAALVVARESSRRPSERLGFAHVNYGRLFIRDRWTLFAIARELNCEVADLLPPLSPTGDGTRWPRIVEAAEVLLEAVQAQGAHVQSAMRLRASGLAWSAVARATPGRVMFSLQEDTHQSYLSLAHQCEQEIDLLASYHDDRLTRKRVRRSAHKIMLSNEHSRC